MELFVLPYRGNISTWRRESVMFAIEKDAPAPQFKSLKCALRYSIRAHCVTRRVRLLVPVLAKMAVNLHPARKKTDLHATHKTLLVCFLLSCRIQTITCVQHTKNSSCAVHEIWLACSPFCVTCVFWFESWQKLKNTCVFTASECQLRCELYCTSIHSAD